ncbi:DUF3160 domain-containing protein [Patescibacteria group bacterium]|nr:DUF3160 domain-containing protein [Patescibacteria group bacterium]
MKKLVTILSVTSILAFNLTGCMFVDDDVVVEDQDVVDTTEDVVDVNEETIEVAYADPFAKWDDIDVVYTAQVPDYTIDADLGNVDYSDLVNGPDGTKKVLAENGFVVLENGYNEFFSIYEDNRYEYYPSFVTTDSVLHTYHLYFNFLLKSLETNELYDLAESITDDMMALSLEQYAELEGTDWQNAAKRNVAFFAVAQSILSDGAADVPALVADEVASELALIAGHQGITGSPAMTMGEDEYKEDYSQYIPRGHYTTSEPLKRYFKALMWYGRLNFRLKYDGETKSALLMVSALKGSDEIRNEWKRLFEPINFFVGQPDDLVYSDYMFVAADVFGDDITLNSLIADEADFAEFIQQAKKLRDPGINSMAVMGTAFTPEVEEGDGVEARIDETKGYRFLGQRFTIDASIFQKLICREVGNKDGSMPCPKEDSRMLPKGLDVVAAFGSELAYNLLVEMGETDYAKYPENMEKMQKVLTELPKSTWTENLYWGWLYTLETLGDKYGAGYPMFMQNESWNKKELITFLGSWAELKHDTILYAKQVYAEMGGGPMIEERDDRGYVEPNPELYARLASLTKFTADGLEEREILSEKNKEQLDKLGELLVTLKDISIKELENENLTDDEYEFIKTYGGSLEHFWYETFTPEEQEESWNLLDNNPAPLIADVATDPNGSVLEVGTGYIEEMWVIFPIDGKLRVGRGGVYSYYEFPWPMDDRLTDEKWRDEILWSIEDYNLENDGRPAWQDYLVGYNSN